MPCNFCPCCGVLCSCHPRAWNECWLEGVQAWSLSGIPLGLAAPGPWSANWNVSVNHAYIFGWESMKIFCWHGLMHSFAHFAKQNFSLWCYLVPFFLHWIMKNNDNLEITWIFLMEYLPLHSVTQFVVNSVL